MPVVRDQTDDLSVIWYARKSDVELVKLIVFMYPNLRAAHLGKKLRRALPAIYAAIALSDNPLPHDDAVMDMIREAVRR